MTEIYENSYNAALMGGTPYYDDFDPDKKFLKVLFKPGLPLQAREVSQIQTLLQNQIERFGNHMFQEGTAVIPGNQNINPNYYSIRLASTFAGETIDVSQYFNASSPIEIQGATSGVRAKVIGFKAATATTQPLLYVHYVSAGSDLETTVFQDGENIFADAAITPTTA